MVTQMACNPQEPIILQKLDSFENEISHESINCELLQNKISLKSKLLNILHLNIRSIHKNFNEFLVFLSAYNLYYCDIIVLGESFQSYDNQYGIDGYTMFYNNARHNRNDGVVVFVKSSLIFNVTHTTLNNSNVTVSNISLQKNNKHINIICLYRPPNTTKQHFLEDLENYLTLIKNSQLDILLGDININILEKNDNTVNSYLSMLNYSGFLSCINSPTRVTPEVSSCLDHIFVRNKSNIDLYKFDPYVLHADITDHYPIMLNISMKTNVTKNKKHRITTLRINAQIFSDFIKIEAWNSVLNTNDVTKATDEFYKTITNIRDRSTIKKTYFVHEFKKTKSWITNGLIASNKNRDKMKKYLLIAFNDLDYQTYKQYRNNLHKIIQKCKHDYYKNKIEDAGYNLKKIYKLISEATDNSSHKHKISPPIKDNSHDFLDNRTMANYCNEYFTNIGMDMLNKIKKPTNEYKMTSNSLSSLFLKPVNGNEIIKHIYSLKNNSAPGIDMLSAMTIKKTHAYLVSPLVHIINLIFKSGIVPEQFKISIVTPIYKSGDKSNIGNYRPISLINNFSKIFEKCLKDRLLNFLQINNMLSNNQYGFVGGVGTNDALYQLTKQVTDNLENNEKCIGVFLDLAKAFDTVPHGLLLDVLYRCGVRGAVLNVFRSYLDSRKQFVKIEDTLSDSLNVRIGVPQGTVLGPLLFVTYINSLTDLNLNNGSIISYADDTVAIFSGKDWYDAKNSAINGISKIKEWLDTFKLSLNVKKQIT